MRVCLFTIAVSVLAASSVPALAAPSDSLPFTPAFAEAVGQYRDCVIGSLDHVGMARPDAMAAAALTACGDRQTAVLAQLTHDINAARPQDSAEVAAEAARNGMAQIDPMIAAVALDHARDRVGGASAGAPALSEQGHIG